MASREAKLVWVSSALQTGRPERDPGELGVCLLQEGETKLAGVEGEAHSLRGTGRPPSPVTADTHWVCLVKTVTTRVVKEECGEGNKRQKRL